MKLFCINAMLILPDDFKGGVSDALRLTAKRLEENPVTQLGERVAPTASEIANEMPRVISENKKLFAGYSISEGDFQNGWKTIEQ